MFRIILFLLTNLAILVMAGISFSLFGWTFGLRDTDLSLTTLLGFCFLFGMVGAMISLLISKWIAKRTTRARIIEKPKNEMEDWLVRTVETLAREANIGTPEIAIFPAQNSNAFATGWNRNNSLVAVSEGMLKRFGRDEIRAVLGHEIGHVANGDMITLALIQGIVNTFVMFFARIIGMMVDRVVFRSSQSYGIGYYLTVIVAEIVLGILASIIVFWFSRRREYRADEAGARLAGKNNMISALRSLQQEVRVAVGGSLPKSMAAYGISAGAKKTIGALFSTHPPLEDRIKALQDYRIR